MTRTLPDANDRIIWVCNDPSGSTIINNTGFIGNNGDLTNKNLNPVLGAQGFFSDGLYLPGSTTNKDYFSGANTFQPTVISVSAWVYCRSYTVTSNNAPFVGKVYRNDNTWTAPFYSVFLGLNGNTGNWMAGITTGSVLRTVTISNTLHPFPLNVWTHVGMTYDESTLRVYINGILIESLVIAQSIDYGTGGVWFLGAVPPTNATGADEGAFILNDIRIADVVRSLDYFKNVYSQGINI